MNRGKDRRKIYHHGGHYHLFLKVLKKVVLEQNCKLYAYCLMPNHFHLMVQTPGANIHDFMKGLCGEYAQKYNFFRKGDGALFKGRYRSVLVSSDAQALYLSRYIHRNPVKDEHALVNHPLEFEWSSFRAYCDPSAQCEWLDTQFVLQRLLKGNSEQYLTYVSEDARRPDGLGYLDIWDQHYLDVTAVISAVAKVTGEPEDCIRKARSGPGAGNYARELAVSIASLYCHKSELEKLSVANRATIKKYRDRWVLRKANDRAMAELEANLLSALRRRE